MSNSYTIKFIKDEILPVTRDGLDYQLTYSYVPSVLLEQPEEESNTSYSYVIVGISRTLATVWNLNGDKGVKSALDSFGWLKSYDQLFFVTFHRSRSEPSSSPQYC